jgi:acetyl-CoA carboxylase biotin carboxyl carrier protein
VYLTSEDVQDILRLLDTLPFGELRLRTSRFELTLCRDGAGEWTQQTRITAEPEILPPASPAPDQDPPARPAAPAGSAGSAGSAGVAAPRAGLAEVRAPLPGTFYRAPRPGAPPFVELGSPVGPDTVVGIVETMKLMNSVCAGQHGTVEELCVADAEFAPQDAVLMRIDPGPA